ncbi:MAG: ribbon-helix-helix domain-containing protein [Candidatus Uhrbacteria bacterium]
MRNIINISLPLALSREVNQEIKRLNFASKSEFFRYLFREWQGSILSKELEAECLEANSGKVRVLKNAKGLWKK